MILSTEKNEKTTNEIKVKGVYKEGYGFIAKKTMRDRSLNVISKAIYAYICSYTGKGYNAFPSQKLISADLGINKGTLVKYIKELKDNGYITVIQHKEKGKFAQNLYTINILPHMVLPYMVATDTETARYGQKDTNNNNINNNIKINNIYLENQNEIIVEETEAKKEKMDDISVEIQQIIKKYCDLGLPNFDYRPDNYILLEVYRELGAVKLFEALTLMSQSEFVKNNMSVNSIFKVENLKKALNGNFKDKANKVKKTTVDTKKEFKKPVYKNFTGDFIEKLLKDTAGGN
ncbi:hypothetical protein FV113G1_11400 [Fusobacterium varium]|nr:hypothetical protein FV113G1_11400 [Fusobacterium varium]